MRSVAMVELMALAEDVAFAWGEAEFVSGVEVVEDAFVVVDVDGFVVLVPEGGLFVVTGTDHASDFGCSGSLVDGDVVAVDEDGRVLAGFVGVE